MTPQIAELRSSLLRAIRDFFYTRGYREVDTPLLVRLPGQEPNLEPFLTELIDVKGARHEAFLITSPEYAMKKLLARGEKKIFQLSHCFRNREDWGGRHNPEFTLLEWYEVGQSYEACMTQVEELVRALAVASGVTALPRCDLAASWKRLSMHEAWRRYAQRDLEALIVPPDSSYEQVFFKIFLNEIEPHLGAEVPCILYDYPARMSALAKRSADGRVARRFEVYIAGVELANAFDELTDPEEQRARFKEEQQARASLGYEAFPLDEALLAALPKIPQTTGVALGVDRLLMLLVGATDINDVIYFPARDLFRR
jgi:lysyl-tRNA synthetase class 2